MAGHESDQHLFQKAEVFMEIAPEEIKVEDGISYQLTGAVVGGLTAAIGAVDRVGEKGFLTEAGIVPVAPHRIDGFMLEKEQVVFEIARDLSVEDGFLQVEALVVGDPAEPSGRNFPAHRLRVAVMRGTGEAIVLRWVNPMAIASAASLGGVSVSPSRARIIKAT